jgi:hypothetical protein
LLQNFAATLAMKIVEERDEARGGGATALAASPLHQPYQQYITATVAAIVPTFTVGVVICSVGFW